MEIEELSSFPWVIGIRGEVDADNCDEVLETILRSTNESKELTVAIAELTFLDSSGISALLRAKSDLEETGRTLRLDSPTESVYRVLEITGLLEIFGIAPAA